MPRYEVTVFHDIGSAIVEAEDEKEAKNAVNLLDFFSHGFAAGLQKRTRKLTE